MVALIEHQAKALLAAAGVPVPDYVVVRHPDDVAAGLAAMPAAGGLVVKAQVPAKNRAEDGGVVVTTAAEAEGVAREVFGRSVHGHLVRTVLLEQAVAIASEWFVCIMVDPWGRGLVVQCSASGGSGVEDRLAQGAGDEYLFRPGATPSANLLVAAWGWAAERRAVAEFAARLCAVAVQHDLLLLEINPLAVTGDGSLIVLDAHVTVDDAAEFRQGWLSDLEDELADIHPGRAWRRQFGGDFAVTNPDGRVALLNTGAGAGMLLMDELDARGITSYDFSDIRAGNPARRPERFRAAVELILYGSAVETVLICVHAGITDLREVGGDLLESVQTLSDGGRNVVVRLQGPHSVEASAQFRGRARVVVEPDLCRAVEAVTNSVASGIAP